jgi:hypothetical protein
LVAAGDYPTSNLRMKPFVDLFGGFSSDWIRDVEKNATTLNGGDAGPIVFGANDARLDGFIITKGKHSGAGGAIVCNHASPTISNNVIRGNSTVKPADFPTDMIHQHGHDGGAIAIMADANPTVRNNLICDNTTGIGNGGGIYINNHCAPKIVSNVIVANHTGLAGRGHKDGTRSSNGGGIAVSLDARPTIAGNVIAMNTTTDNSDGGGIYLEYDASAQIRGNWIVGNFGEDDGGGMYVMKASEPRVELNFFAGNRNTSGGSCQIRLSKEGRMRASHNVFAGSVGSPIDTVGSWMVLANNTFVDDKPRGAAIVENESQHIAPTRINGNLFAGPKECVPFVKANTITKPVYSGNGVPVGATVPAGNTAAEPAFVDDSARLGVADRAFDAKRFVTTVKLKDGELQADQLVGRVVNVGDKWSVVRSNDAHTAEVWGDVSASGDTMLVLGTYQQAEGSPCKQFGAYAPGPATPAAAAAK